MEPNSNQHQYLFLFFCWLQILFFSSYSIPLTVFPEISVLKGLNNDSIGFALAAYPISYFLVSILCGKNMDKWGGKKVIFNFSFVIMIISTFMFLILDWIDNHSLFLSVAIIIRLLQGISIGGFAVVLYSLIPHYWPDSMEKKLGLLEFCTGLGMGIGPLISGFLYYMFGYIWTFGIIGLVYFLNFLIVMRYTVIDEKKDEELESPTGCKMFMENEEIIRFLKDPRLIVTIGIFVLTLMACIFLYPILGTHVETIGGNVVDISISFASYTFSYSFGSIAFGYFTPFSKANNVLFGAIITVIAFIGINFAYNVNLLLICMGLIGFGQAIVLIPQIPLMIEICLSIQKDNPEHINNMVSGFFNAGISISEYLGPILGGCFYVWFGFTNAIYSYALILSLMVFIYIIFLGGDAVFKKRKRILKENEICLLNENKI